MAPDALTTLLSPPWSPPGWNQPTGLSRGRWGGGRPCSSPSLRDCPQSQAHAPSTLCTPVPGSGPHPRPGDPPLVHGRCGSLSLPLTPTLPSLSVGADDPDSPVIRPSMSLVAWPLWAAQRPLTLTQPGLGLPQPVPPPVPGSPGLWAGCWIDASHLCPCPTLCFLPHMRLTTSLEPPPGDLPAAEPRVRLGGERAQRGRD